jgi:subtilase family serine protease
MNCSAAALALLLPAGGAFGEVRVEPIRSGLQPDLVIVDVQVAPANPNRLRVRVANQGLAPAADTRMELVYQAGGRATPMGAAVPSLKAGERRWLIVEVGAPPTNAEAVTLRIDEPSLVIESDEGNNGYRFK